jgi:hypothetical protein
LKKYFIQDFNMKVFLIILLIFMVLRQSTVVHPGDSPIRFPEISGMYPVEPAELYTAETLFEYINGAAESYLLYYFQELSVQIYENEQRQSVTIEIYRHLNQVQSFGIYSQERPLQSNFLNIGTQAYQEPGMLNFLKGSYYIKINAYDFGEEDQKILREVAEQLVNVLEGGDQFPRELRWFPQEGKIENSERFISQNFLGYTFFKKVFTADYRSSDEQFTLFLLDGNSQNECREILESYLQSEWIAYEEPEKDLYMVNDKYQGSLGIVQIGHYLLGIKNIESTHLRSKFLRIFDQQIRKSSD